MTECHTLLVICFNTQAERELNELGFQVDSLNDRLEEADGLNSAQVSSKRVGKMPTLVGVCRIWKD
jgi:hypothetical protein